MQSFSEVRMLFLCLAVLHFIVVTARASVVFEDCGSAYDLKSVNIEGCGLRLPCYVTLGEEIPVNVEFYADFVSRQLDQDVTININFIHARTSVTPEPCETVMCPVQTDAVTSFTSVMSVPTNMALNQRGFLQWRVYNENGMQVLCYYVIVQTQNYFQKVLRRFISNSDDGYEPGDNDIPYKETLYKKLNGTDLYMQRLLRNYYKNKTISN
ncbi:uncharacterized protein LOC125070997 [Vanessa atalanta]|uniref:uncharacterized protein LOC125070997 n=1 Tax=Vanessa atalanta TaxID=42275 RepID=UPI001FCD9FD9|nr:uncharacterized protein LOC125070997 [Vanessa atalanta]